MVGRDGVGLPLVGDDEQLALQLGEDGTRGGGQVGRNGGGQKVHVVDGEVDDGVAALALVGEQVVIQLVLLKEAVAEGRKLASGDKGLLEVDALESGGTP